MSNSNWDYYGRWGIDLASSTTSFGFKAAKTGTRLGVNLSLSIFRSARLMICFFLSVLDH